MNQRLPISPLGLGLAALTVGIGGGGILASAADGNPLDLSAIAVVTFLAFPAMGLLILRFRPDHVIGYLLLLISVNVYFTFAASDYARYAVVRHPGSLPFGEAIAWMSGWNWIPFLLLVAVFLPLLFPDGRLLSRRWWIVLASGLLFAVLAFAGNAFVPGPANSAYPDVVNPLGIKGHEALFTTLQNLALPVMLLTFLGSVSSVVVRYRRADGVQRRQLRWFLFGLVLALIPFLIHGLVPNLVAQVSVALAIPLVPVAIAIAVLRYRLYDIDIVINRALVYGALAAFISVVYVAIVVGLGTLLGANSRPNVLLSIVATALVAIAFQPVRARVQRLANRFVYGKRATPYEVMAGFAKQMAGTLALDRVLPQTAEAAARGVGAAAARISLFLPDGSQRDSTWPVGDDRPEFPYQLPVRYQDQVVGQIAVAKAPSDPLTRDEQALLHDLAAQVGLVLHNVRLAAELQSQLEQLLVQAHELQASRQRIVTAQETERRRLEEDIRHGVQRNLDAIAAQLEEADRLLDRDSDAVAARLDGLVVETQKTLDRLREVARGIFPPILADRGLFPALQAQLRKVEPAVSIEAPPDLEKRRFDPEIETAVYFTCLEAIRRATPVTTIRFEDQTDGLRFSIDGLSPNGDLVASGDRIAAVGGELRVQAGTVEGLVPVLALRNKAYQGSEGFPDGNLAVGAERRH